MADRYQKTIRSLVKALPWEVDLEMQVQSRPPTMASSQFLTNKEQGEWAEEIALSAINGHSMPFRAIRAGRTDSVSADDPGFPEFYVAYLKELNRIGKRPDLLVFREAHAPRELETPTADEIKCAAAAIEVRSSSFLAGKYSAFMKDRASRAEREIGRLQGILLQSPYSSLLKTKAPGIHKILENATEETFREIRFRRRNWSSSEQLRELTRLLKELKEQLKVLQKRDYLSITPKLEDIVLVNRWIQHYGVPHYYLQVFFDKAYLISFEDILKTVSDSANEGDTFQVEQDVKNQHKTTLKIDVQLGKEVLGKIDMPNHQSKLRELERGRLLYYVAFSGGRGYLDSEVFLREVGRRGA